MECEAHVAHKAHVEHVEGVVLVVGVDMDKQILDVFVTAITSNWLNALTRFTPKQDYVRSSMYNSL